MDLETGQAQCSHSSGDSARLQIGPLVEHLLSLRTLKLRSTQLFAQYCLGLRQLGVPLDRATLHVPQLHPQLSARSMLWLSDTGGAMETGRRHGLQKSKFYLDSPVRRIYEGEAHIHRRIPDDKDSPVEFPILNDLRDQGYRDYYITALSFSTGSRPNAVGFSTRTRAGFTDRDLALIEAALPAFGAVLEVRHQRDTARSLLTTYVGPNAGTRVLNGAIQRGQGEVLSATVWYCDLRGFTQLSQRLAPDEMVALLNDYFEIMAQPVKGRGGEILKFIGDAMLAVFPISLDSSVPCRACHDALLAAMEALDGIAAFNELRRSHGREPIRVGIAMSQGDVTYGNIGDAERLDFTVIGPAVNLATRMESLTRDLDPPVVFTRDVAEATGKSIRHLGAYTLKGIAEPQDAFTLA